jgi:hypothetical protein
MLLQVKFLSSIIKHAPKFSVAALPKYGRIARRDTPTPSLLRMLHPRMLEETLISQTQSPSRFPTND